MNLTVGLFGKHHVTCGGRGIVASRDALGDGHADRLVGKLKKLLDVISLLTAISLEEALDSSCTAQLSS